MKITITSAEFIALERVSTAALERSMTVGDRAERESLRSDVRAVDNVLDRVRAHTLRGVG